MTRSELEKLSFTTIEINNVLDSIRTAKARACNATTSYTLTGTYGGKTSDKVGNNVSQIVTLQNKLDELKKERDTLLEKLNAAASGTVRLALKLYYIDNVRSWREIASRLGVDRRVLSRKISKCIDAEK